MRKYILFFFILLLLLLSFLIWKKWTKKNNEADRLIPEVKRERAEPAFKPEGRLYFLHSENPDTLASIGIEIVDTPEEIEQGLMYRTGMAEYEGMLFIFSEERMQSFWMKNTRFSLDIIFVNQDLRIVHIARHTIPFSSEPIPGMYPARYVLELNAGFCDTHNIDIDSRIRFKFDID